ncbi:hypothetical protein ACK3SF_01430 [Candidatus Nanosalina sp. VS9-1]|uniref:hypothetical protein n=1 Tax=Candidatus Nanosalina sp. VS9-1 TaxID=3388566 RepID=UPI0039E0EA7F
MSAVEYTDNSIEDFVQRVKTYDASWTDEIDKMDVEEDGDFMYLELEASEDIASEFHELGLELSAHTAEINNGERYRLAREK